MKTPAWIAAILCLAAAAAWGQGASLVFDESLNLKTEEVIAKLNAILQQAEQQNAKLQQQIDRAGDPSGLYAGAMQVVKQSAMQQAALLKTQAERAQMFNDADGKIIFGRETYGIATPVQETVTLEDGTTRTRDADKYKIEGKMLADIDEYRRVREEALALKKSLTTEMTQAMQDLEGATDLASIQKYSTLIQVLQGQIAGADRTAQQAFTDMEVLEREMKLQASASRKAAAELAQMENDAESEVPGSSSKASRRDAVKDARDAAMAKAREYLENGTNPGRAKNSTKGPSVQWRKPSQETPPTNP
ncbi:MAG: hypothetical protein LDL31_05080 [Prosthecobacter sp.]|jgi:hypothetical protein|nr:hypothetical protein [Prosthecobacter sp.]